MVMESSFNENDNLKPTMKNRNWLKIGLIALVIVIAGAAGWYQLAGNTPLSATEDKGAGLFPFLSMNKWGYMDSKGKVIITPQFSNILAVPPYFSEGLAPVEVDNKWGYINEKGDITIQPQFEEAWLFQDGLAAVYIKTPSSKGSGYQRSVGYIDKTGQLVVQPQSSDTWNTYNTSLVRLGDSFGEVNNTGPYMARNPYEYATDNEPRNFSDGLLRVQSDGQWGYMGKDGNIVIKPIYKDALDFSEGKAAVRIEDKWGYIDTNGVVVIKPQYDKANVFSEGLAVFGRGDFDNDYYFRPWDQDSDSDFRGGKWGFIKSDGTLLATPQFDGAKAFSEGLAAVKIEVNWGYIDKDLNMIIEPKYAQCLPFSEGRAAVCMNNKWGYIDAKGNEIIKMQFDQAGEFASGLAQVIRDERRGYINTDGEVVRWDE